MSCRFGAWRCFVGEGEVEEFVDRLAALVAQPRIEPPPPARRFQQLRQLLVRRREAGAIQERRQQIARAPAPPAWCRPAPAPAATRSSSRDRRRSLNSSSSVSPTSGDFSSAARLRSSSGSSRNRQNAIRSMTAIWSSRVMRSTPTTGMARRFKRPHHQVHELGAVAHQDHDIVRPRPAAARRSARCCRCFSRCAISRRDALRQPRLGRRRQLAHRRRRPGRRRLSVAIGRAIGHTTISPYSPIRLTVCSMFSSGVATPARAAPPNTVSTISSTAWVERNEVRSGTPGNVPTRSP